MNSPEDVEQSAGCQTSKNCSSEPQDLYMKKIQNIATEILLMEGYGRIL